MLSKKNNSGSGYYVMKWGGMRYSSVGWYPTRKQAQDEIDRIMMIGAWSGMPPKIEKAEIKPGVNPAKVISHRQALQLTERIISYAKKLFKHEIEGTKRYKNPGESYHMSKFMFYMKELEKWKIGSCKYISTLAKAYEHLQNAEDSVEELKNPPSFIKRRVKVFLKDGTYVGTVAMQSTSIGAAKLAGTETAKYGKIDGEYVWIAYNK